MTPFDLPLPDYEIPIPIKDGYLNVAAALKRYKDEGRSGTSVTFRLPAGVAPLPVKTTDPLWYVNWNYIVTTEETQIAFVGAVNGTTEIVGGPLMGGIMNLPSTAVGIWRAVGFTFRDFKGDVFSFGTGPYSNKKNSMVLERIKGRYIYGRLMMAACEQNGTPAPNNPSVMTVVNDELWMSDVDVRYQAGSHMAYIDQRAYVNARRCKFGAGGNHIFKTAALNHDLEDCVISNVDPDTGLPHVLSSGVSSVFPNGQAFSGDSAPMSTIALSRIHAKRCKILKVWVEPYRDGGAYGITRQARWDLARVNPELVDPSDEDYWRSARAAGIDNPENPYLFASMWESCTFENRQAKPGPRYVIGNQSSHPAGMSGGSYFSVEPRHPALWFERSRDFMHDCTNIGFSGLWRQSYPWAGSFPVAEARINQYSPLVFKTFLTKPDWWPESGTQTPQPPPPEPDMATIQDVITDQTTALDTAYSVAGQPSLTQQLAALQTQVNTLTTENAALQTDLADANTANGVLQGKLTSALTLVDAAIAADTQDDLDEAARLAAAKAALQ